MQTDFYSELFFYQRGSAGSIASYARAGIATFFLDFCEKCLHRIHFFTTIVCSFFKVTTHSIVMEVLVVFATARTLRNTRWSKKRTRTPDLFFAITSANEH